MGSVEAAASSERSTKARAGGRLGQAPCGGVQPEPRADAGAEHGSAAAAAGHGVAVGVVGGRRIAGRPFAAGTAAPAAPVSPPSVPVAPGAEAEKENEDRRRTGGRNRLRLLPRSSARGPSPAAGPGVLPQIEADPSPLARTWVGNRWLGVLERAAGRAGRWAGSGGEWDAVGGRGAEQGDSWRTKPTERSACTRGGGGADGGVRPCGAADRRQRVQWL